MADDHNAPVEPTPLIRALIESLIKGNAAIVADLRDMAEGNHTGRHCQAYLAGGGDGDTGHAADLDDDEMRAVVEMQAQTEAWRDGGTDG
jgi:hypothetical protein